MPAISLKNIAAGTANALEGLRYQDIPPGGAYVTIYATAAVAGGVITFGVGSEVFLDEALPNVESAADVVDVDRDLILPRQPVPPGKQFLRVATQIVNALVVIEYP